MFTVDLKIYIYRPPAQVFTFVATPENDFQWQYGTLASTQISKGEIGTGTLIHTVAFFIGRRIETICEVTEFEPNKRYGFNSLSGPIDSRTLYIFEMLETGTRINLFTETNPRDLVKTNDVTVEKKFRKQYKENLAMLKSVLETHPIATT
jgi:hypothetical protein